MIFNYHNAVGRIFTILLGIAFVYFLQIGEELASGMALLLFIVACLIDTSEEKTQPTKNKLQESQIQISNQLKKIEDLLKDKTLKQKERKKK